MSKCVLDPSYPSTCPHPHLVCQHCHKRYCTSSYDEQRPSLDYCPSCWNIDTPNVKLEGTVTCIVPGCENRTDLGDFDGPLCLPCADFIRGKKSPFSQAYRNEVARFGEWLAKMQQTLADTSGDYTLSVLVPETVQPTPITPRLQILPAAKDET